MIKPTTNAALTLRPAASNFVACSSIRPALLSRAYATQNTQQTGLGATTIGPKRRRVTAFNDDGYVPWNDLSAGEKAARASQQTYNLGMILVGVVLTGGVGYFLWHDVFSPDSKTSQFNRAVDKIKDDERCVEILGQAKKISAHGDETFNKWRRARPVASSERQDPDGTQHILMHFYVDGPSNNGVARLHMVKYPSASEFTYKYLYLDVKGHDRIYLEKEDEKLGRGKKQLSFFGIKW